MGPMLLAKLTCSCSLWEASAALAVSPRADSRDLMMKSTSIAVAIEVFCRSHLGEGRRNGKAHRHFAVREEAFSNSMLKTLTACLSCAIPMTCPQHLLLKWSCCKEVALSCLGFLDVAINYHTHT